MVLDAGVVPGDVDYPVKRRIRVVFDHSATSEQAQQCGGVLVALLYYNYFDVLNAVYSEIHTSHGFVSMSMIVVFQMHCCAKLN